MRVKELLIMYDLLVFTKKLWCIYTKMAEMGFL